MLEEPEARPDDVLEEEDLSLSLAARSLVLLEEVLEEEEESPSPLFLEFFFCGKEREGVPAMHVRACAFGVSKRELSRAHACMFRALI